VLTIADRYETVATAIAASYMNIPVAHTQGGEVTGTIDESVRHAVTKFAHIHFPASKASAQRIVKMGEPKNRVYLTGGPEMDIITKFDSRLSKDFFAHQTGVGSSIDPTKPYILVVQHPVTTEFGSGFAQIKETIQAIYELGMQTVVLWPNIDAGADQISKGLRLFRERRPDAKFHFYKNFSPEDYARVMLHSACAVGNSSSFIREGSYLGVPAVMIGTRQTGREHGKNIVTVAYSKAQIKRAILQQVKHGHYKPEYIFGFGDGKAGERIARVLATCPLTVQKQLAY
jgi:UDP-hydrolysing UDP-N-acetyl-D-glucosamine 2-epimerase